MKNLALLIVLVFGLAGGYFIGQHRGKEARKTLEKAVETGKALDRERTGAIAALRKELDGIGEKYRHDIEASRKNYETKAAEWRRTKSRLDGTIERQTKSLAAMEKAGAPGGTNKDLARFRKETAGLRRELDGDACLKTLLPGSVLDALDDANPIGAEK